MVPNTRLIIWTALILVPLSLLVPLADLPPYIALICILFFLCVVSADALKGIGRLDHIRVQLPPLMRWTRDKPSSIPVQIANDTGQLRLIRLALPWPPGLTDRPFTELLVELPADLAQAQVQLPCVPRQRGRYHLSEAFLETESPLGFWAIRKRDALQSEARVYPSLHNERNQLASIFLRKGALGVHAQRQLGQGREFEKLREYLPGDGFDEIHWKATAKRGHPVTKMFQIERTQEIYVALDSSRLSARPVMDAPSSTRPSHEPPASVSGLERVLTSALVLALAAEQQGDLFGLITFSDKVDNFVRARNGKAHYAGCRDALYAVQPREVTPDFDELATFIRLRLRRRALLIIFTSLDDPVLAENFMRNLPLLSRQHVVLVNMLRPGGLAPLFTGDPVLHLDDLYERFGGHLRWANLRELEKNLKHQGVRFSLLNHEKLSAQLVTQYLDIKRRQLL